MPNLADEPSPLEGRIFRAREAIRAGLVTRHALRGPRWRRWFYGIYADASLPDTHRPRCRAAARFLLPKQAAVAGRSAACVYGVDLVGDHEPVEVVTPPAHRFGPVAGLIVHVAELPADEIRQIDGIRCTTPLRTCWDLASWLPLPDAVAYLDRLLATRVVTASDLTGYTRTRAGRRGWRKLSRAVALADPAAESPAESRLRVRLVLAGLPKPVSQYVIERNGRFIGRVDLAWPELKVAVEYDGRWHDDRDQFEADRARLNRLVTTDGWIILHATARRVREDLAGLVAEIRAAMRFQQQRRRRR